MHDANTLNSLVAAIKSRQARVGIIGLGYVGLPLALAFVDAGFSVVGFDVDSEKIIKLNSGLTYLRQFPDVKIAAARASGRFEASLDFAQLERMDVILICVPTPLTPQREPDMSFVEQTVQLVARHLRRGQLIVLESTTYPGTTREFVRPILEGGGLRSGSDFLLAYSPEREDPGNLNFHTTSIPKVVGGDGVTALHAAASLYESAMVSVVPVSTTDAAEAVKITENIFRSVNIALVNELKIVFDRMGIDIWEVIEAAKTKPFGYMPFYPGPGLGGHCIPIDPFYLTWKARQFDVATRFIELAGEINTMMPRYVVDQLAIALNDRFGKALKGTKILIVGVAYKKNVEDCRESPAFKLIELLESRGAVVDFYDPMLRVIPKLRQYPSFAGRSSVDWKLETLSTYDAAVICTDHDVVNYSELAFASRMIVDTRNATKDLFEYRDKIVKA